MQNWINRDQMETKLFNRYLTESGTIVLYYSELIVWLSFKISTNASKRIRDTYKYAPRVTNLELLNLIKINLLIRVLVISVWIILPFFKPTPSAMKYHDKMNINYCYYFQWGDKLNNDVNYYEWDLHIILPVNLRNYLCTER